jgi:hypothetical protein
LKSKSKRFSFPTSFSADILFENSHVIDAWGVSAGGGRDKTMFYPTPLFGQNSTKT